MDFGDDSFVWRYKYYIATIAVVVLGVLLLSVFTGTFDKTGGPFFWTLLLLLAVFLLGGLLVVVSTSLKNISETMAANSAQLDKITSTLEKSRAGLAQINHSTHLSEAAKAIAFRDSNRQALREAVFEKLQAHDFEGALEIIDEIRACRDFPQLADHLLAQCESYRSATDQERVTQVIAHLEKLIEDMQWPKASAHIEKLIRDNPASDKAREMRQRLVDKKQERKRILLAAWDDAVTRQDTDRSLEILRELDSYLTPKQALALQEAASDVFRTKLHNLGVQFSLALSEHQWARAINIGKQIIRDFPNSRMSGEIRSSMDKLQQKATTSTP